MEKYHWTHNRIHSNVAQLAVDLGLVIHSLGYSRSIFWGNLLSRTCRKK